MEFVIMLISFIFISLLILTITFSFLNIKRTTYEDLLKTKQWKEKREEILKRDNYKCQYCGRNNCELHVHHKYYNKFPNGKKTNTMELPK